MKIAAVVILYNPTETVVANIKSYYDYVDKIFVFDNSEEDSTIKDQLIKLPKIAFRHDFENKGIAKRLNEACALALQEQFGWLLTMDQDTTFGMEAAGKYFDCVNRYQGRERVAMFGTLFSRRSSTGTINCITKEADKLITSGSL